MSDRELAATFVEAMRIWDAQKAEGVPRIERLAGLERTLRAAWPFDREWKYLCQACNDLGLEIRECPGDATCGRDKPHLPHEFGKPCWCSHGAKFREKPKYETDHTEAGATVKRRPMRLGKI